MAVPGCALLLVVAGCGGGGGSTVEETMQLDPTEPEMTAVDPETDPMEPETGAMDPEMGAMEPAMPLTLESLGAYERAPIDGAGSVISALFHRWGIWGGELRDDYVSCTAIGCPPPGITLFMAYIEHQTDGTVGTATQGTPSGTSPAAGVALWTGDVKAYETADAETLDGMTVTTYTPVEGTSQLEVDFAASTVDVDLTNFDNSRADISWDGLAMSGGTFGSGTAGIEGSFYGAGHEGAAGTFARDGLTG